MMDMKSFDDLIGIVKKLSIQLIVVVQNQNTIKNIMIFRHPQ